MQCIPTTLPYPDAEAGFLRQLQALFEEWHRHFIRSAPQLQRHEAEHVVFDGFYPHYFSQEKRILFVGRESRQISGFNHLELLYPQYRHTKRLLT